MTQTPLPESSRLTKGNSSTDINKHIKQDWGDRNSGEPAAQSGSFCRFGNCDRKYSSTACFSTTTTKNQLTGIKWLDFQHLHQSVLSSEMFCCSRKKVFGWKDAWRNWWNLRFVGHFNIQVIIPSEMYCKWTVCLTFLSVCSSPSVSQLATSTNAKIRLFCWLPLPYFNSRPFRDLLQNARIKLLPDQRCSVFMRDFKDFH